MAHCISIVFLSIAANLDNLIIGLVYGLRGIRLPFCSNLILAVLSGLAMLISGFCGRLIGEVIPSSICQIIGGAIVALLGMWIVFVYVRNQEKYKIFPVQCEELGNESINLFKEPERADIDNSGDISWHEAIALGIALALNCLALGIGVGLTRLNIYAVTAVTVVTSLLAISFGIFIGKRYGSMCLGNYATPVAGIIMFMVGLYEMML